MAPARRCAYAVLRRVFERGAFAERALRAEARSLSGRDLRLATRLAYGAVQRRRTLDHFGVPPREKDEVLAAFAAHKGEVTEGSMASA